MSPQSRNGVVLSVGLLLIVAGGVLLGLVPTDLLAEDGAWLVAGCLGGALVAGGIALTAAYVVVRAILPRA